MIKLLSGSPSVRLQSGQVEVSVADGQERGADGGKGVLDSADEPEQHGPPNAKKQKIDVNLLDYETTSSSAKSSTSDDAPDSSIKSTSSSGEVAQEFPSHFTKRLQKELQSILKDPPEGVIVDQEKIDTNLSKWIIEISGASGTLYEGEIFKLQFKFGPRYPFDAPEVVFIPPNVPVHPHVYSNGHICMSVLSDDWTPVMNVRAVCLSIISMLSSTNEKKRPPLDWYYTTTCRSSPKETKWSFHDSAA